MPNVKKNKGLRGKFKELDLQKAVEAVINGDKSLNKAATDYGIDRTTLRRYVKENKKNPENKVLKKSMITRQV